MQFNEFPILINFLYADISWWCSLGRKSWGRVRLKLLHLFWEGHPFPLVAPPAAWGRAGGGGLRHVQPKGEYLTIISTDCWKLLIPELFPYILHIKDSKDKPGCLLAEINNCITLNDLKIQFVIVIRNHLPLFFSFQKLSVRCYLIIQFNLHL